MAVITVSREYGSRAEEISQQVARALGYSYFDKEILADVARAANTTEEKISSYDEKNDEHGLRRFLRNLFLPGYPGFFHSYYYPDIMLDMSPELTEREPTLNANEVTSSFRHVIESMWERGNVVIVGE